jgi:hypothetical protein
MVQNHYSSTQAPCSYAAGVFLLTPAQPILGEPMSVLYILERNMKAEQVTAIRCAYADLQGAKQAMEQGDSNLHDWKAHAQTLDELMAAFPNELGVDGEVSKVQEVTANNAYSNPINEVLYDLTWGYTHWHDRQTSTLCADIMDELNGSRGIFEWLFDQAMLFQAHWMTLPLEYRESGNYMGDVDAWLSDAVAKLAASVYSAYPHVERMKCEIWADVRKGVVPITCKSFSELHDYVDANCYGGFCEEGFDETKVNATNDAQNAIDLWIKAGGLKLLTA